MYHNKGKHYCIVCMPDSKYFCSKCRITRVSPNKNQECFKCRNVIRNDISEINVISENNTILN
jgi:hypothetical protein